MMFGLILLFVGFLSAANVKGQKCIHKGVEYKNGEVFKDECNSCFCSYGDAACTQMTCNENHLSRRTSEPHLPNKCWYNNQFYDVGESFMDAENCNRCSCIDMGNGETGYFCTLKACITLD